MLREEDGSRFEQYSTAGAEVALSFADPIPADAVLSHLELEASLLGTCMPSRGITFKLNPGLSGVFAPDEEIGTAYPATSMTSCSQPARFTRTTVYKTLIAARVSPYVRGGQNVLSLAETNEQACGDVRVESVAVTLFYYLNVPRLTFELTDSSPDELRRLLMKQHRADYPFFNPAQTLTPIQPYQPVMPMLGRAVNPDGTPYANGAVYARTSDPPDVAPYLPAAERHYADNPLGLLFLQSTQDSYGWREHHTDADGRFEIPMNLRSETAGDNVVLEVSAMYLPLPYWYWTFGSLCKDSIGCYTSGPITMWRRVFIENDRMFKFGSFIRANVTAGATEIPVITTDGFANATSSHPIRAVLLASPANDPTRTLQQVEMEICNVIGTKGRGHKKVLLLDQPVARNYYFAETGAFGPGQAKPSGDAIGRWTNDADLYESQVDDARAVFDDTFTDVVVLPTPTKNRIPFFPKVDQCTTEAPGALGYCSAIALKWFEYKGGNRNHEYVIAGSAFSVHGILGVTNLLGNISVAFVFNDEIQYAINRNTVMSGLPFQIALMEVTAHEMVHLFDVNQPASITAGHCDNDAWDGGYCLMNERRTRAERGDGRVSLHVTGDQSEYRRIRRRPEPLPDIFQSTYNPNP